MSFNGLQPLGEPDEPACRKAGQPMGKMHRFEDGNDDGLFRNLHGRVASSYERESPVSTNVVKFARDFN